MSRKRRRPALSCEQCRRRKVRCDREMPCGPCAKSQPSLDCEYVYEGKAALNARIDASRLSEHESPPSGARGVANPSSSTDGARITHLEATVLHLQNRVHILEEEGHVHAARLQRPQLSNDSSSSSNVNKLDDHIADLERQLAEAKARRLEMPQTCIAPLAPHLKKDTGGRTKLFGTTHWALSFQQFRLLRQVRSNTIYADGSQDEISKSLKEIRSIRRSIKARQAPRLVNPAQDLLDDLPPREICDELIQHYLRTLGLVYRVLHIPSFFENYDCFWKEPQSVSTGFLLKLLLILAIGSIFHCKPGPSNELGIPVRRWVYAAQWWLSGPTEKEAGGLEGLQVHCLLLLCRQGYAIDKETNWISAGSLLRLAVNQGLHRDPRNFSTLSVFDAEMRRRIWATILEINVQLSIDASMPPLFSVDDSDTSPPSNLDDEDFDQTTTALPPSQPKDWYTNSSLQILLSRSFPARLRIARIINQPTHKQSYESTLHLGSEIAAACKEMAATFHDYFSHTAGSGFRPTPFHHRLMDSLLRRFLLNLYRPFAIQAIKDPRFYLSRKLSFDSALCIASYAEYPEASPSSDQIAYQDFQRLCLSGAGLFKGHLSLDVMVVIGLELITQLEEEVAQYPSATVPFPIDQIAEASRAPPIKSLERIKEQLYQSLEAGIPSMKRYGLLSGILAQITAVPRGEQATWIHIRKAVMDGMQTCRILLQRYIDQCQVSEKEGALLMSAGGLNGWTPESAIASSLDSDFMIPNLGFEDLNFWDIPALIDASMFDPQQLD
ncbi:hypothetical protein N7448_002654 [Penicillium atrosanguineum]|uniref:Uncharacterized protein n=1 Tax=Penicillium atrosanguineum TaxID=1132637 RepID=A0A9W9PUH2_9EURO|nr:hypothetical protein N7526_007110 [Penicillium atrosanguineum]KAJ5145262.1 hypothetical protein N7448_002654 [Penicillium atrosanguineum]KAJ5311701.1 hypothetical protein N7476_007561 [Penicillium atrosanguineum]